MLVIVLVLEVLVWNTVITLSLSRLLLASKPFVPIFISNFDRLLICKVSEDLGVLH